jgi:hypothetical protein
MQQYACAGVPVVIKGGASLCFANRQCWTVDTLKAELGHKVSAAVCTMQLVHACCSSVNSVNWLQKQCESTHEYACFCTYCRCFQCCAVLCACQPRAARPAQSTCYNTIDMKMCSIMMQVVPLKRHTAGSTKWAGLEDASTSLLAAFLDSTCTSQQTAPQSSRYSHIFV